MRHLLSVVRGESWLKLAVDRGLIPFSWAVARRHHQLRRSWPGDGPTTFNEKCQYKLMHDRRPIVRTHADKFAVRDYVRAQCPGVRLPRLLAHCSDMRELDTAIPPAPWVMKASHGSSMILIGHGPGTVTRAEIHRYAYRWLHMDYGLRYWEWQYFRLPRRILFEEYLGRDGLTPDDYKLYVVHGKVRLITVDHARYVHHTRTCFWPDWSPTASYIGPQRPAAILPPRPARLQEMIDIAETLSGDCDAVRIDLYYVGGQIYFGEITHSPAAGELRFSDRAFDEQLGRCWQLPRSYDTGRRLSEPPAHTRASAQSRSEAGTAAVA